ncbi:MAG: PRC-barrel domain-containing protein [Herpetosiphon sp.]
MRKGTDLIGKPVVSFDTGEVFEHIQDLVFDQTNNQLLGFVVDEGGWFSNARVLPLTNIHAIGQDDVIVPNKQVILEADSEPRFKAIMARNNVLKGTKIVTTDGRDLGTLTDLYFDEHTGVVEGYEASGGIFADAYTGRAFIPAPSTLKIGEDVAFVPPETADLMEEQAGGLKGAVQNAADAASNAGESLAGGVTDRVVGPSEQRQFVLGRPAEADVEAADGTLLVSKGQTISERVVDEAEQRGVLSKLYRAAGGSLSGAVSGAVAGKALEQSTGRRVNQAVRTPEGLIIAAPGQIVTEQVVNRAHSYHMESQLLEAVGLSAGGIAHEAASSIQGGTHQATQTVKAQALDAKASAGSLWDKLKEKVSTAQERASEQAEESRIKAALGRPVDRVILDPQDNVILNVGEIITNKAITMARESNVLDILLSSVSDAKAPIGPEDMKADVTGEAALDTTDQRQTAKH